MLKSIDRTLGTVAAAILPGPGKKDAGEPRSFLVIRPGGIGDALLLIPALQALKKRYPQAAITVLAEKRNAAAFVLSPAVDQILLYDKPDDLLAAIRGRYDVVIDTEQWHRLSAVVGRLANAPVSIGFATNNRKRLFTRQVPYSQDDYEVDSFLQLLAPLGIDHAEPAIPFLTVPDAAAARVAELLPDHSWGFYVTIFPGASIPERRWGADRFRRVADHLSLRGVPIVVVGGEEDAVEGGFIVRGCRGMNLAGKTSLPETAAVIARSALLISGDSGVLHLAVGLGISTVSLFGPGIEAKWGPRGEGDIILNRRLSCSPCTRFGNTPACPTKASCMSDITVEEVVSAAMTALEKWAARRDAEAQEPR